MRFDYLNLRAFGHFTDYQLLFDQTKNFHLMYGPNEAGKSTALRSITHFLYGFPQQTNDSFLHSNTKLRIEGQLKSMSGETLQFIRRKGNKNTVLDVNGGAFNEALINAFLNGMTEEHFLNMFALDHVRLRAGGEGLLQSGGNLGESLFSAASGISVLRKVFAELEKKSGELYKKRGSTPEINKLIKKEKELKKEISEYQLKIQSWKELERKYHDGKKAIEDMITQVRTLRRGQEKLQRVKLTLPRIARKSDLVQKLAELGDVPTLPDNIEAQRMASVQRLETARKDKRKAEVGCGDLEKELNDIRIPEGVIEQAALIDALYREVKSYQDNENDIPGLEGKRKQLEESVLSFMKEIDAPHADLENIDSYRLSAEKKETIRERCKQKPLHDQEFMGNESELKDARIDLQEKQAELRLITDLPDIDGLEEIIDKVKRSGQIEASLKTLKLENEQKERQINEEIRQLPQWDGTYQELIALPIPGLTETVKKFAQERAELTQKLQKTTEQIKNQKNAVEEHEGRIRDLDALAEIPSEDKLSTVRGRREEGWQLIRTKLQQGSWDERLDAFTNGQAVETVYEASVRDADDVADKMRIEAEKVGEKNKRLSDIESCNKKIDDLANEESGIKAEVVKWEAAWLGLWQPSGIIPLTPGEMQEWLVKYGQIKGMIQEYEKAQSAIRDLDGQKTAYKLTLISALSEHVQVSEEKTVDELLSIAEKYQKKVQDDLYKRKMLEAGISDIKRKVNTITNKKADIEEKISHWKSEWIKAIKGTNISENTPTSVAESLLGKYEQCAQSYDDLKRVEKEQEAAQEKITLFKGRVRNVLQSVTGDIDQQHVAIAVNQLNASLQQAKQDRVSMTNLTVQLKKRQSDKKEAVGEIVDAEMIQKGLIEQAKCHTIEELEQVEKTFTLKKKYESDIQVIEEELLQFGSGLSLHQLSEEADKIEHDSIEVGLEEIKRELDDIESARSQLEQDHGVVKKEYEEKIQGNNTASVVAEQKKESLLAQLANLTDQYIQLKLASTLLQRGIEHYRNQNQDPILKRASELFARLTLQSFAGLMVDYDEKDQPVLMGIRASGENVAIDGMSDGTTDQLYLSLRLASIEKYVSENEPIPLIVDDILVHFDDTRSKETLKILLELSNRTQIIFFTHHARLVEIIKDIALDDDYQLTEIGGLTLDAVIH